MKKILALIVIVCMVFCLCGCSRGSKNYNKTTTGRLIPIVGQSDLYYDANTKVVYILFNECAGYTGYGYMSPYYADNGLPYVYNVESNTLEKINVVEENSPVAKWV